MSVHPSVLYALHLASVAAFVHYLERHWNVFSMNHGNYILKTANSTNICSSRLSLIFDAHPLYLVKSSSIRPHHQASKFIDICDIVWSLLVLLFVRYYIFLLVAARLLFFLNRTVETVLFWSLPLFYFKMVAFVTLFFSTGVLIIEYFNSLLLSASLCYFVFGHIVFAFLLLPLSR